MKLVEMGKSLLISYLFTGVVLAILSYFVFQYEIKESMVNVCIVATYVLANFVGGFICGKKLKEKKFLWGLLLGAVYAGILILTAILMGNDGNLVYKSNVTLVMLCTGGGMLGGMLA